MIKSIRFITEVLFLLLLCGCDPEHTTEYNRIGRTDIAGYEEFIAKYPSSIHVGDARERIEVARQQQILAKEIERKEKERLQLIAQYAENSLSNGSQPYSQWYGSNRYFDDYTPHSEIRIKAPHNSDVIAIVRYNNHNGRVAGHKYIKAGQNVTIYLPNGSHFQTFFYYGKGWYPRKEMKNGIKGGFVKDEAYSKDGSPSYLENTILTYELTLTPNGNFSTSSSDENEIF